MQDYNQDIANNICAGLIEGKSLAAICRELDINYRYVYKWIAEYPEFKDNYAHAREAQADYLADGIIDIADEKLADPNDRRVRIDARKWYAGKLKPKKYGERTVLAGDEDNPINHAVTVNVNIAGKK